jgi:hypothetical protein
MKTMVKFLSVVILFLSTSLSAQRTYKMSIQNNKLVIESVDSTPKTGIVIQTDSTPMFELYDVDSKVLLGTEKKSNFNDDTIAKFKDMNNGDTKISDRLKFNIEDDCVELFYYSDTFISNYFTPQLLDKTNYVLKIKDSTKTLTYTIKNGKIEKETL